MTQATSISVFAYELKPDPELRLDTIHVIYQITGPGQGRVTITCWGEAWTAYWPAMGDRTLCQYIEQADTSYLVGCLHNRNVRTSKSGTEYLTRIVKAIKQSLASP